jgi:hypothetical protein
MGRSSLTTPVDVAFASAGSRSMVAPSTPNLTPPQAGWCARCAEREEPRASWSLTTSGPMRGCMTSPICSSDPRNPRSITAGGLTNLPIRDTLPWYWARRVPRLLRAKSARRFRRGPSPPHSRRHPARHLPSDQAVTWARPAAHAAPTTEATATSAGAHTATPLAHCGHVRGATSSV